MKIRYLSGGSLFVAALTALPVAASAEPSASELAREPRSLIADRGTLPIQMSRDRSVGLTDEGTKLTIRIRPVIPENQDWDMITVNYYPDRDSFFKLVRSEVYHSAGMHKHAALERTMTIVTLPGGPVVDPGKATDK
jgi:hypothetical protein